MLVSSPTAARSSDAVSLRVLIAFLVVFGVGLRTIGKVLPTRLTPRGRRSLEKATVAVRSVEVRMLGGMTQDQQSCAFRILQSMIHSLRDGTAGT